MTVPKNSNSRVVKIGLTVLGVIITWSATVIGAVWFAGQRTGVAAAIDVQQTVRLQDHENRLRTLELKLSEMAADVRWIRSSLEKEP